MILGKVRAPCWLDESSQRIVVPGLNGGRLWRSCIFRSSSSSLQKHRCGRRRRCPRARGCAAPQHRVRSPEVAPVAAQDLTLGEGFTTQVVILSGAQDFDLGGGFHYSGSFPMVFQHSAVHVSAETSASRWRLLLGEAT